MAAIVADEASSGGALSSVDGISDADRRGVLAASSWASRGWPSSIAASISLTRMPAGAQFLAGHIPGARYADLNRDLSAPIGPETGRHPLPAPEAFAHSGCGSSGIGNGSQVVAYDAANGSFAARLWWLLRWVGHRAVAVLDGGFTAWIAAGGALESGETTAARAERFTARIDDRAVLSTARDRARDAAVPRSCWSMPAPRNAMPAPSNPSIPSPDTCRARANHPFTANLDARRPLLARRRAASAAGSERLAGQRRQRSSSPCAAPASPPATIC